MGTAPHRKGTVWILWWSDEVAVNDLAHVRVSMTIRAAVLVYLSAPLRTLCIFQGCHGDALWLGYLQQTKLSGSHLLRAPAVWWALQMNILLAIAP